MLNFQAVRDKQISLAELVVGLTRQDLGNLTKEMADTILNLVAD